MSSRMVYGDPWEDLKDCLPSAARRMPRFVQAKSDPYHSSPSSSSLCSSRNVLIVLAVWLFALTVACIVIGAQISKSNPNLNLDNSSGSTLSRRLEQHATDLESARLNHAQAIDTLNNKHHGLQQHLESMTRRVDAVGTDLSRTETRLRSEAASGAKAARDALAAAIDRLANTLSDIKKDVQNTNNLG